MTTRRISGFTLLEVLVVLVIVGIIVSMAALSFGVLGSDRELDREAATLQAVLLQAREDAMLSGQDIGLRLDAHGYDFALYDAMSGRWGAPAADPLLRERTFPEGLEAELRLESRVVQLVARKELPAYVGMAGRVTDEQNGESDDAEDEVDEDTVLPQIVVQASGDLAPFEIMLRRIGSDRRRAVIGSIEGNVEVTDPDANQVR